MSEEEEKEEEEDEDNDEEKEENDDENEEKEKNEEEEELNEENEDDDEEGEKEENKNEEDEDNNDNNKKKSSINKFLQSKLKPASEIKIDLKSNEKNISNKLNISNHSILTAAFANTPPIPVISTRKQPIQLKSTLQIITDINNDMDLLSTKLNKNIPLTTLNEELKTFKNNFHNNYDKEDYEIKKLINKTNEFTNTNTDYTTYKNNLTYNKKFISNLNNFSNYKTKYFLTNNNYNESSIDSKDDYLHKNFKTLPNLRNDYSEEKNQNYYENDYTSRRMSKRMKNNYTNTDPEDSLYSKDYIIGKDCDHFRNLKRKKIFINNNMTRNFDNIRNKNRANTYDNTHKLRNFLTENGINDNKKHLYLRTFNNQTMKKPLIYTQPESYNFHKNFKRKNFSSDSKNYNNYILDRDNYCKNKKSFYRFNSENDNRAINILLGNE